MLASFSTTFSVSVLSALAGGLFLLGFVPLPFEPLHAVAVIAAQGLMFYLWSHHGPMMGLYAGLVFGLVAYGSGMAWSYTMVRHLAAEPGVSDLVFSVLISCVILVFILSTGLLGLGMGYLRRKLSALGLLAVFPLLWALAEWSRLVFPGFPLMQAGDASLDTPLAGYVPVLGSSALTVIMAFLGAVVARMFCAGRETPISLVVTALMLVPGLGAYLDKVTWTTPVDRALPVTLIHGDISPQDKHQKFRVIHAVKRYTELSEASPASRLVVWPESAFAYDFEGLYPKVQERLALLHQQGTSVFAGAYRESEFGRQNVLLDLADLDSHYAKRHLVPYAEFEPSWAVGFDQAAAGLSMVMLAAGPEVQGLLQVGDYPFASMICFENMFSAEQTRQWREATFSVVISDLSWFSQSVGIFQLAQLSRLRALESGKPLLQSANQGMTMIVDHKGNIQAQVTRDRQRLDGVIVPRSGTTPYVDLFDWE